MLGIASVAKFWSAKLVCNRTKSFNYDHHGEDWEECNCESLKRQSPIALDSSKVRLSKARKLYFLNYNKELAGPLTFANNGHTAVLSITPTEDGTQPAIVGNLLQSVYQAIQIHFHWGSPESKGSEHTIDSVRHDAELHIVHRNCAYDDMDEALQAKDGHLVLGIMLESVLYPEVEPIALNNICEELQSIRDFKTKVTLKRKLRLEELLGDLNIEEFFSYEGSLTTPPCSENVNWFVFSQPVAVSSDYLQHFWSLEDDRGQPLLNNYRTLQPLNNRPVYFRANKKQTNAHFSNKTQN